MADVKITDLPAYDALNQQVANDVLPIVQNFDSTTKKISIQDILSSLTNLDAGTSDNQMVVWNNSLSKWEVASTVRALLSANGGLEVDNQLTAAGFERVLTVSDLPSVADLDPGTAAEQTLVWSDSNNKWQVSTRYREDARGLKVIQGLEFGDGNLAGSSRAGYIGHESNVFLIESQANGEHVQIVADNSSSASRTLFDGDPDSGTKLRHGQSDEDSCSTITSATGGLQVNNQLTGAGLERVLTESDALPKKPTIQTFTANGTWTKPANLAYIEVTVIGGGGGSGGKDVDDTSAGGGAGGTSIAHVDASSLGATEAITIGAGGTAGASGGGNDAGDGGATSFGTHASAGGGTGGVGSDTVSDGGLGGIGTTGDILIRGGSGNPRMDSDDTCVFGGASYLGGAAPFGSSDGAPGTGAPGATIGTSSAGSAGLPGIVIVKEYY